MRSQHWSLKHEGSMRTHAIHSRPINGHDIAGGTSPVMNASLSFQHDVQLLRYDQYDDSSVSISQSVCITHDDADDAIPAVLCYAMLWSMPPRHATLHAGCFPAIVPTMTRRDYFYIP